MKKLIKEIKESQESESESESETLKNLFKIQHEIDKKRARDIVAKNNIIERIKKDKELNKAANEIQISEEERPRCMVKF